MTPSPRIALIHATPVAVAPVVAAFARLWPEAKTVNVSDDSLSPDRAKSPALTDALRRRFDMLADYAMLTGAAGILFTCSAFGPAIEAIARRAAIPALKPNEAMFEDAFAHGRRIGMIATFAPAAPGMEEEFAGEAARLGVSAQLTTVVAEGAMAALRAGDAETHNRLVAEAAAALRTVDAIMLAHFSTARAAEACRAATLTPVLTSPEAAVLKLRARVASS